MRSQKDNVEDVSFVWVTFTSFSKRFCFLLAHEEEEEKEEEEEDEDEEEWPKKEGMGVAVAAGGSSCGDMSIRTSVVLGESGGDRGEAESDV